MPDSLRKLIRLLVGLAIAAMIWEGAVLLFGIRPYYLPRLSTILTAMAATPRAYVDGFLRTLAETLIGFASGGAFGVLMGVAFFPRPRAARDDLSDFRGVADYSGHRLRRAGGAVVRQHTARRRRSSRSTSTFFPVTVNTLLGLETVDPRQVDLMRSFGASIASSCFVYSFRQHCRRSSWRCALPHR